MTERPATAAAGDARDGLRRVLSRAAAPGAIALVGAAFIALLAGQSGTRVPEPDAPLALPSPMAEAPASPHVDSAPAPRPAFRAGGAPPSALAGPPESDDDGDGDGDGDDEHGSPREHAYEPDEHAIPAELLLDAPLAPRAPITSEPFVPREIVIDAVPAPRVPMTSEPFVPVVIELDARPATGRD